MRLLLDTNVFLRLTSEPELIAQALRRHIDEAEARYLSIASAWEMAIKVGTGKLRLEVSAGTFVREWAERFKLSVLAVELHHLDRLAGLPMHHRDPFDRVIVAQALCENLTVVTSDRHLEAYGIHAL